MLKLFWLGLCCLSALPSFAWELMPEQEVSEMRHLVSRQELLVKTEEGVWRFDERGVLLRGPAPSTERLWRHAGGKEPAALRPAAFYAVSTGLVFVLQPHNKQVHVIPHKD